MDTQDVIVENEVKIKWSEKKMDWSDFQGPIPFGELKVKAISNCNIHLDWELNENDELIVSCYSYLNRKKSWYVKAAESSELLNHEQRHFDIAEINARLLVRDILNVNFKSASSINGKLKSLFYGAKLEMKHMQNEYDKETDLSRNTENQLKWNNKIDSLLLSSKSYSKEVYVIEIGHLLNR